MTLALLIIFGVFLLACESLYVYRGKLISSHRALARSLIIGETSLNFWVDVNRFNSYKSYEEQFFDWRKWRFEAFYPGVYADEHATHLGGV